MHKTGKPFLRSNDDLASHSFSPTKIKKMISIQVLPLLMKERTCDGGQRHCKVLRTNQENNACLLQVQRTFFLLQQILKIMMFQISVIVILILALPSLQLNWQGTGSMNSTVMNQVNTLITNNPLASSFSNITKDAAAQAISTALNDLWDPAWNVVIVKQSAAYDTVVYGYAFNNHWMWINGIPVSGDSASVWAYIIWKDYNCQGWKRVSSSISAGSTFTSAQSTNITNVKSTGTSGIKTDVWTYAHNLVNNVQAAFGSGAVTVVVSQDPFAAFNGYVCLLNNNLVHSMYLYVANSEYWGSLFLFQTRA